MIKYRLVFDTKPTQRLRRAKHFADFEKAVAWCQKNLDGRGDIFFVAPEMTIRVCKITDKIVYTKTWKDLLDSIRLFKIQGF